MCNYVSLCIVKEFIVTIMISKRLNYNINEIKSGKYFGMLEVQKCEE